MPWGKRFLPSRYTVKVFEPSEIEVAVRDGQVVSAERARQLGQLPEGAVIEKRASWGQPVHELDIVVCDGRPRCVAVRSDDGLTGTKLRFPLEEIVRQATAAASTSTRELNLLEPLTVDERAEAEKTHRQRRQQTGPPSLAEVARVYREADPKAPIKALCDRFHYSRQHAHRLVNRARAAGEDLPPAATAIL